MCLNPKGPNGPGPWAVHVCIIPMVLPNWQILLFLKYVAS